MHWNINHLQHKHINNKRVTVGCVAQPVKIQLTIYTVPSGMLNQYSINRVKSTL